MGRTKIMAKGKGKRGAGDYLFGGFVVFLLLAVSVTFMWQAGVFTALPGIEPTILPGVAPTICGEGASLEVIALDEEADPVTQVASYAWVVRTNGEGVEELTSSGVNVSLSASAKTTIGGVNRCEEVKVIAFDGNYYGEWKEVTINKDNVPVNLKVHRIQSTDLLVEVYDKNGDLLTDMNITLNADDKEYFERINIEVNESDRSLRFSGLGFNTTSGSNIKDITVQGMAEQKVLPERLSGNIRWLFEPESPVLIPENEKFTTQKVIVESKGTNPSEIGSMLVLDKQHYKTADALHIGFGYEDDQSTPVEVGRADYRVVLNFN